MSSRVGSVFQIGRPSSTSQMSLDARMKRRDVARRRPQRERRGRRRTARPAAPWLRCRFVIASVKISCAGPGAIWRMLSSSVCVAESPSSPRTETSARIAGKIARIE